MPFDDLTKFLQAAADAGELERIMLPLSPDQEIAALTHQICREFQAQSPVILFEQPTGGCCPVVTNLLGNRSRFLRLLGVEGFDEVIERLRWVFSLIPAHRDWKFGLNRSGQADRGKFTPRSIRRGLSQQVVKLGKEIDLTQLPVLRSWSGESGPMITAGQVITESSTGAPALEQMPLEVLDEQTLQLHWNPSGPTFRHWQERCQDQRQLPVAISLGGDPLLSYAASLPIPGWIDPWFLTGVLRNEGYNLVRARSVELNVPAEAEMILEGYLDTTLPIGAGAAAGANGILQHHQNLPQLKLTALTHRANPVFPARIQALDVSEELVCSQLTEQLLLGILRLTQPSALDLHLPACGGHRDVVFVRTSATTSQEVQQLFHALCSLPFISPTGLIVAVGAEVDLRDETAVWREVCLSRSSSRQLAARLEMGHQQRLLLDATSAALGENAARRCLPAPEILDRLAGQFGNSSWDGLETPVSVQADQHPALP